MYNYIAKITRLNDHFMTLMCMVDIINNLLYIGALLIPGALETESDGFIIFYCITSGTIITINIILILAALKNKNAFAGMPLLKIYMIVQVITILGDIVSGIINRDFWIDGYVWIMLEIVLIVCYAQRYYFLDLTQKALSDEGRDNI